MFIVVFSIIPCVVPEYDLLYTILEYTLNIIWEKVEVTCVIIHIYSNHTPHVILV